MPRIRSLKPEHKVHRKVGRLSDRAYRLWVGLLTEADDEGRFVADPDQLRALVFPYQRTLSVARVEAALGELVAVGLIGLYAPNGTRYGAFPSWQEHQRVDHVTKSRIPPPIEGFASPRESSREHPEASRGLAPDQGSGIRDQGSGIGGEGRGSGRGDVGETPDAAATPPPPPPIVFQTPVLIMAAVAKCPTFRSVAALSRPEWWQRQVRGHPGVDFAQELVKAESWLAANPSRAPRKDLTGFLWRWFAKAARDVEAER